MTKPKNTARPAWSVIRKRPRTAIAIGVSLVALIVAIGVVLLLVRSGNRVPAEMAAKTPAPVVPPAPVAPAPRPATTVTFDEGCVTPACHASFEDAATIHAPVAKDACDVCHAPDAGGHTFPLIANARSLCENCHDVSAAKPFLHEAMTEDGCLVCHDPHASSGPFLLATSNVKQTCVQCHPPAEGMTTHPPYAKGECLACHEPHASDNPNMLLAGGGADACGVCHRTTLEEMETAAFSHRDTKKECLACHAPHASNQKGLLTERVETLCLSCHDDVRQLVNDAVVTHDAVRSKRHCLTCHTPHAADNARMLATDQSDTCLQCHDKPVTAHDGRTIPNMTDVIRNSPFKHGPVKSNQCGACHAVHGARYARLLKEINPELLVGSFNIQNYALCFSCHTQNLVLEQRTTVATEFRNGDLNLHYVHVKKGDRARSCGTCHRVHGSDLPYLMADSVAYQGSDWIMPVKFVATPDGGSCAPGCHEPLSYSRTTPVPYATDHKIGGTP